MSNVYSKHMNIKSTPQSRPIPGRTDMIENNAGGYSFGISDQELLERFVLIGTEGGTFYVKEQDLTVENATRIISYIKKDGVRVLDTVVSILKARRAPKVNAGLFVLALVTAFGSVEAKKKAYNSISEVCVTATHLFMFLSNIESLRGWSSGLRKGVAKWYTGKDAGRIAYQMAKYRNREGFTHRDALRLSHPKAKDAEQNKLFGYAVGKVEASEVGSPLLQAFEKAMLIKDDGKALVDIMSSSSGLTWEMIPTEMLNNKTVLTFLASEMPATALLRNLNRFAINELTTGNTDVTKTIVRRITSEKEFETLHPINVLNTKATYASGRGFKGSKTWIANQNIVDALDDLFYRASDKVEKTGKDILIAVDVSGSMSGTNINGMALDAREATAALSSIIYKAEANSELLWFDTNGYIPQIGRRSSLSEILSKTPKGGGTDCSIGFKYAMQTRKKFDAIIILTDTETWAGRSHGIQLLDEYRKKLSPDVKVIEIAMVANSTSDFPQEDKNVLRVCGFDSSVPLLINEFIKS